MWSKYQNDFAFTPMLVFGHYDKVPKNISWKEERFILALSCRGVRPWCVGSVAVGLSGGRNTIVESWWQSKLLISWQPGGERKRGEKSPRQDIGPRSMPLWPAPFSWASGGDPMARVVLCFSFKTKDVNVWVAFSKLKPKYPGLIAVLTLCDA